MGYAAVDADGVPKGDSNNAYWETVRGIYYSSINPEINTNIGELYSRDDDLDIDAIRDATLDFITESVDGSEWVTVPHYAQRGLTYTRHRCGSTCSACAKYGRAMHCAMMADIRELQTIKLKHRLGTEKAGR